LSNRGGWIWVKKVAGKVRTAKYGGLVGFHLSGGLLRIFGITSYLPVVTLDVP